MSKLKGVSIMNQASLNRFSSMGARLLPWTPALPVLVATILVLAATLPMLLGNMTYVVMGGSMEPTILLGAAVVVERTAASELAAGDIITYQANPASPITTHRILS